MMGNKSLSQSSPMCKHCPLVFENRKKCTNCSDSVCQKYLHHAACGCWICPDCLECICVDIECLDCYKKGVCEDCARCKKCKKKEEENSN